VSETKKQVIDQAAHALWGMATGGVPLVAGLAPFAASWMVGVAVACGSAWFWTHRERLQFRNGAHIWWDPLLDNGVFWVSVGMGAIIVGVAIL